MHSPFWMCRLDGEVEVGGDIASLTPGAVLDRSITCGVRHTSFSTWAFIIRRWLNGTWIWLRARRLQLPHYNNRHPVRQLARSPRRVSKLPTMSLYADDEDLYPSLPGSTVSATPTDPLQALAAAVQATPETPEQADALQAAGTRFEDHPDKLPEVIEKLLPMVVEGPDSLLRAWTLDMLALTVGRAGLRTEVKMDGELGRVAGSCGLQANRKQLRRAPWNT